MTKYNTSTAYGENPDNKTTLDLEDDAARANMGDGWRIPTQYECQELIDNTTNKWITNYNGTGVNGRKFISKTDESKYIFIPAAGEGYDGLVSGVGEYGTVWISSLNTSYPDNAWCFRTSSSSVDAEDYDGRSYGFSVRSVCM